MQLDALGFLTHGRHEMISCETGRWVWCLWRCGKEGEVSPDFHQGEGLQPRSIPEDPELQVVLRVQPVPRQRPACPTACPGAYGQAGQHSVNDKRGSGVRAGMLPLRNHKHPSTSSLADRHATRVGCGPPPSLPSDMSVTYPRP